jgi:large conductance mechanosensitive channel
MIKEFKDFAVKGNVVDMAVGIVIGGAFGKIVSSLVNDVIMPPVGMLLGGIDFSKLAIVIKESSVEGVDPVTINYGMFVNSLVNFVIIAFSIFMVVKAINAAKRKEEEKPAQAPKPSNEEILLAEIRDALKK